LLQAFAVLLVFQCLGEALVFLFGLPVPGPVAGMLLLLVALVAWPRLHDTVERAPTSCCATCRCCSCRPASASSWPRPAAAGTGWRWRRGRGQHLATLAVTGLVLKAEPAKMGKSDV
jgi:holin-like protein